MKAAGASKAFLEKRGFVTARVRRLPGPSWDWRETPFRGSTRCPGRGRWGIGQEGWLRPWLGRGHTCVPASVGLLPSPSGSIGQGIMGSLRAALTMIRSRLLCSEAPLRSTKHRGSLMLSHKTYILVGIQQENSRCQGLVLCPDPRPWGQPRNVQTQRLFLTLKNHT